MNFATNSLQTQENSFATFLNSSIYAVCYTRSSQRKSDVDNSSTDASMALYVSRGWTRIGLNYHESHHTSPRALMKEITTEILFLQAFEALHIACNPIVTAFLVSLSSARLGRYNSYWIFCITRLHTLP